MGKIYLDSDEMYTKELDKKKYILYKKNYQERMISRVNRVLSVVLGILIFFSVLSYYFITSSEMKLNKLRKETLTINDENMELQNHLDYLKSYTNVNKRLQDQNIVKKATEVVEISTEPLVEEPQKKNFLQTKRKKENANERPKRVEKFKWSLGY